MNTHKPWLVNYPDGVPHDVDISGYRSLLDLFSESFSKFRDRKVIEYLGHVTTYKELDQYSAEFAAYLQSLGLPAGSRVAIMLPNVLQYQVAMIGVLRAGYVVVNVNPQYTARELEHQLSDSGAQVLIVLENFAHVYASIATKVPMHRVIVTSLGEMIGLKGKLVDFVVRHVKRLVPAWNIATSTSFKSALAEGKELPLREVSLGHHDIAFLQYTGGTTGISKGAILLHRNVLANILQVDHWLEPAFQRKPVKQLVFLCALPLYHIFALTACGLLGMKRGGELIMVPNPKDIGGFIKLLLKHPDINIFPAVNTLFNALLNHPLFSKVQLPHLLASVGGGMAVHKVVADRWQQATSSPIIEGYGLSETAPVATVNLPLLTEYSGHIGLPVSGTEVRILDDAGFQVPYGTPGEICIRGPQVMAGYWNKPEETQSVLGEDGFFRSGDIGVMDEDGFTRIVDRKKDMILVSGFNVYPNELEEVISMMPGVLECAAVGVPNSDTGEAVKVFIVKSDPHLTEEAVLEFCKRELTNYKRPKLIQFREGLPKTNVGKILRRELRQL